MKLEQTQLNCQIPCLKLIAEGIAKLPQESFSRRMKLMARRRLGPGRERALKNYTNEWINRICQLTGKCTNPSAFPANVSSERLQAGDWVRVRSLEEIETTLNNWKQVRGCAFMPEMAQYCGTIQRVLKPMKAFVDERDLQVKRSKGIILLEGVICKGTSDFGSCDRACFHFWREEWLEKLDKPTVLTQDFSSERPQASDCVRVRSLEEIEVTLSHNKQLRGCTFIPEMAQYCGTTQQVLKPMKRFVDECDLKVKKSSGILLLESVICNGTSELANCDRCCYILWREEWLEKLDELIS